MVLVLAMIFSAMLGVMSFAEAETPEAPKELVVSAANLEFNTAVYLYIAVDYSQFGSAAGVSLKITNNKTGEVVVLNPATDITAPANCVAFKYDTIGAKNMGDELTLQALKDGEACGESKVYSILEYALVAQGQGNTKLTNLMVAMLAYGANAQKVMKHEGTYDLSKDYTFVKVTGLASLADSATKAIVERGTKVSATASSADVVWYDQYIQRQGNLSGASVELDTSKSYQSFVALPSSAVGAADGELNGATITGSGVWGVSYKTAGVTATSVLKQEGASVCPDCDRGRITKCTATGCKGTNTNGKDGCAACAYTGYTENCKTCGGTAVLGTATGSMPAWFSGSPGTTARKGDHYGWAPGYFIFGHGYTFRSSKFSSSAVTIAKASKVFTFSITIAADSNDLDCLDYLAWRNGGQGHIAAPNGVLNSGGRLNFLRGDKNGTIYAGSNVACTAVGQTVLLATSSVSGEGPGSFVTVHIVFDFTNEAACPVCGGDGKSGTKNDTDCTACGKDGKCNTMTYYVGESTAPVATVVCPVSDTFFTAGSFDASGTAVAGTVSYMKSMVVTKGNITDYFK